MSPRVSAFVVAFALVTASCGATGGPTKDTAFDDIVSRELPTSSAIGQAVGEVSLPDAANSNAEFSFRAASDDLLVVYFGFTSCPDICPTTLADLKTALADIGNDAGRVEFAMITVDPERDSAATLVDYVQWFIPEAHALRTEDEETLDAVGDAFGAEFSVVKMADDNVEVFHTAYLYGVDDTGRVVATWPFGVEPTTLASDIRSLLTD